jgi:hypothetical protein
MAHALTLSEIKATSTPDTNDINRLVKFKNNNFTANSKMPRPGSMSQTMRPMNPFDSDDDLSMCPNSFPNNLYSPKHFDLKNAKSDKENRSLSFHSVKSDKSNNNDHRMQTNSKDTILSSNYSSSNINDHLNNESVTNTKRNFSSSLEINDLSINAHSSTNVTNTSSNLITSFETNDLSINAHSSTNVTNTTSSSSNNDSAFGSLNNNSLNFSDSLLSAIQNSFFYVRDYLNSFIIEEEDIETIPPSQIRRGPSFDNGRYQ